MNSKYLNRRVYKLFLFILIIKINSNFLQISKSYFQTKTFNELYTKWNEKNIAEIQLKK